MLLSDMFSKKKLENSGGLEWIIDVTPENFMDAVVHQSQSNVVLLDFWAPWCEPCKHLSPLLEACIAKYNGRVRLAKVNIDENENIAAQFRIQSIPTVYAFAAGKPVDAFSGNISEQKLSQFIDKALAIIGHDPTGDALQKMIQSADDAFQEGNFLQAARTYMDVLTQKPDHAQAALLLVKCYALTGRLNEAKSIISTLDKEQDGLSTLEQLIEFIDAAPSLTSSQLADDFCTAHQHLQKGDVANYLDALLELLQKDRTFGDELFKKTLLTFFSFFDADQKYIMESRRRLSKVLFS